MSGLTKPSRVLIIDDNVDAAELMQLLLQMEGFVVQTAFTGTDGLVQLPSFLPQVICIDIEIHDFVISDLIRQIKTCPGLPTPFLVGMTSWDEADHPDLMSQSEFNSNYVKPIHIGDLVKEIRNFCHT